MLYSQGYDSDLAFAISRNGDVYVWGRRKGPCGLLAKIAPTCNELSDLDTSTQVNNHEKKVSGLYEQGSGELE